MKEINAKEAQQRALKYWKTRHEKVLSYVFYRIQDATARGEFETTVTQMDSLSDEQFNALGLYLKSIGYEVKIRENIEMVISWL